MNIQKVSFSDHPPEADPPAHEGGDQPQAGGQDQPAARGRAQAHQATRNIY